MATVERLGEALKNAHAAGDEYAAKKFADAIRALQSTPTPVVPTPAEPEETSLLGYGLETGKALLGGAAGLLESAATGAAFVLPEEAEQAARARIAEIGGGVQDFLATDEAYEGTYTDLIKGVGSTLPFLAAAPLGVAGFAVGALTGITAGAGEAAQRAEAAGATEEEISKAAALGTIPGALEMFPPARIVGNFKGVLNPKTAKELAEQASNSIRNKIMQRVRKAPLGRVTEAAISEGIQEAITEVGQNLISRGVYDPEQGVFTDTGESFGLGAGVGGLLAGLTEAIIPFKMRAAARKAQEAVTAEEAAAAETAMAEVPVDETRDMFPDVPEREGPEPERLLDVEELAGVTEEDPIQVEAEAAVQARYSEAPLSPDAFAAAVANEVDIIRSRETPSEPTPETDLIEDAEETAQIEALVDEDEYADIQAEEDAAKASLDAAVTQELGAIEVDEREKALRDVQQRIETRRAEETQAKRGPVLEAVLAQTDTASQVNTERAFSNALAEAGIADTTPTEAERQAITQKTYELTQQRPEPEVVEPEVIADGTSVSELEALIPEAGATTTTETADPTTLVTPEFFDSLGIPKSAPIRRRKALQGKEVSSPEVQEALQALIKNPKTSYRTRANLLNYRAFGEVVPPTAEPAPAASYCRTYCRATPCTYRCATYYG